MIYVHSRYSEEFECSPMIMYRFIEVLLIILFKNVICEETTNGSPSFKIKTHPNYRYPIAENTEIHIDCIFELNGDEQKKEYYKFALIRYDLEDRERSAEILYTGKADDMEKNSLIKSFKMTLTAKDNKFGYYCRLTPSAETAPIETDSIRFNITFEPKKLEMILIPDERTKEGQEKVFNCRSDMSNPEPIIEWLQFDRNGMSIPINDEDKLSISATEYKQLAGHGIAESNLTVVSGRSLNGRRFECSVKYNEMPNVLNEQRIFEVSFPPKKFDLTSDSEEGVKEGSPVMLTCQSSVSHPPATIKWFEISTKQDQEMIDISDLAIMQSIPGDFGGIESYSKLNLTQTLKDRNGYIYRCEIIQASLEKSISKDFQVNILYPPNVQVTIKEEEPREKHPLTLTCSTAEGNPDGGFTYEWKFEPALSEANPVEFALMTVNLTGTGPILKFESIEKENIGWYACRVSSFAGSAISSTFLMVKYLPELTAETKGVVHGYIGESAIFRVGIVSNPPVKNIQWFRSDSRTGSLRKETYIKSTKVGDNIYESRLAQVVHSSFGKYVCRMKHDLGTKDFQFELKPDKKLLEIPENSIEIVERTKSVEVLFEPPLAGYFQKVSVRVCARNLLDMNEGLANKDKTFPEKAYRSRSGNLLEMLCEDHKVNDPGSGRANIVLPKAINEYSYQVLVYDLENQLIQETSKVYWNPDSKLKQTSSMSSILFGSLISCSIFFLLVLIIVLVSIFLRATHRKGDHLQEFANKSKPIINNNPYYLNGVAETNSSYLHFPSSNPDHMLTNPSLIQMCNTNHSSNMHLGKISNSNFPSCDTSSLRSYQHDLGSIRSGGSGNGMMHHGQNISEFMERSISSMNPSSPVNKGLNFPMMTNKGLYYPSSIKQSHQSLASSQGTKMSMLSNKVIAEVIAAASKAASQAVFAATSNMNLDENYCFDDETESLNNMDHNNIVTHLPPKSTITSPKRYEGSLNRKSSNLAGRSSSRKKFHNEIYSPAMASLNGKASCQSLKNGSSASDLNQTGGSISSIPSMSINNTLGRKKKNKINIKEISMKAASQAVAQLLQHQSQYLYDSDASLNRDRLREDAFQRFGLNTNQDLIKKNQNNMNSSRESFNSTSGKNLEKETENYFEYNTVSRRSEVHENNQEIKLVPSIPARSDSLKD